MSDCVIRGDIFYANLNSGIGSEQRGYRPVLIIQNNMGNQFSPTVIVAVITGKVHYKARLPTHCLLNLSPALSVPSMVLLEQVITIDKKRLKRYVGRISEEEIISINKALSISVGLESL
jgi:mRNA interferase MazF